MLTSIEGVYENGQVRLLEPLPGVVRARVVVTVLPEPPPAWLEDKPVAPLAGDAVVDHDQPRSELGRALAAIRRRASAQGQPLQSADAILCEVQQGRAEAGDDQDLR
ncbi:hypothetical protein [uncultured Thiodictyon sp.]|uniref:hypothetical protein n=1 Tax=uncultured Thiodictyon sp. TaxID=1846217 RepID=UPI0025E38C5D|nr:hypothetical protein [uncultured Thiodictyon sp.]